MKSPRLVVLLLILSLIACNRSETVATNTETAPAPAATDTATPSTATSTVPPADMQFAETASMANLYEIMAGNLATERVNNPVYQSFAQTMVTQHTAIGASYTQIAGKQGLPMPKELSGQFLTLYDELQKTPAGSAFDRLYRQQMISTHQQAVPLFQTEASSGQDSQLKGFAAQWTPTIEMHLQMAEGLPPVP